MEIFVHPQWYLCNFYFFLFNCHLAVPRPTLGHSQGDSLTNLMSITAFLQVRPEGHREPRNEAGYLSPPEGPVGFEPRTFWFWLQCLDLLGHFLFLFYSYFILISLGHYLFLTVVSNVAWIKPILLSKWLDK